MTEVKTAKKIIKKYNVGNIKYRDAWCDIKGLLLDARDKRDSYLYHQIYMLRAELESIENRKILFTEI